MIFDKTFALKEYWDHFNVGLKREHQTSEIVKWDDAEWPVGGQCRIIKNEHISSFIDENLNSIYRRKGLCLKVFHEIAYPKDINMHNCYWGRYKLSGVNNLVIASTIQNLFHLKGLAPKVYDLIFLETDTHKFAAQVTEYIDGERPFDSKDDFEKNNLAEKINNYCSFLGVMPHDLDCSNFKNGLFYDFQRFTYQDAFKPKLIERINENIVFGVGVPYQSIEELGIKGVRDNFARERFIDLEVRKNDSVLDVGCNAAYFLRRAFNKGASYGVGFDTDKVIKTSAEVNNFLGYFNIDFVNKIPKRVFDVVFYLSMDLHYDFEKIIKNVGRVLYLEGHAGYPSQKYEKMLKKYFDQVIYLGSVSDFGEPRVIYKAFK